ncbi:MAG TPA: MFS transporter, partial [Saprospiraceae bacterium]|nr:MFS transporter [Saprospiraceae bacterium]
IVCRLLCGFGVGGILLSSAVFISEIWPSDRKSVALGILSICFPVGIFSAGIITYSVQSWRAAFWEGLIPLGLVVANHFFIRESDQWLVRKTAGNEEKPPGSSGVVFWRNLIIGSLIYGAMLIGLWAIFSWLPTWIQTIISGSDGQQARGVSMMIFATGGLAGGLVSGWLCRIFGLKTVLLWCFAGCFLASVYLFKFNQSLSWLTYAGIGVIAVFFGASQGVLNVYIPELFPTGVRSVATGICFNISRLFTATAVFFIGWLVESLHGFGNALFVFSFVFLAGFLITLFSTKHSRYGIHTT